MAILRFKIGDGCNLEIQCDGIKDAIKEISQFMEVFSHKKCGKCGCENVYPEHRLDDEGNAYYSMKCGNPECGAALSFGQHRKGDTLFAKRQDKQKNWLPNGGWLTWKERQQEGGQQQSQQQKPQSQHQSQQRPDDDGSLPF